MKNRLPFKLKFAGWLLPTLLSVAPGLAWGADEFTLATAPAAAEKGNATAEYYLARHFAKGDGVPLDIAKAADYMRRAADHGLAFAQNDLGAYYARGLGVKQDFTEAHKWYLKAAENGDPLAQYSLGRDFSEGRGVDTNLMESLKWFKRAGDQNQPDALMILGDIYMNGRAGIPEDYKEAGKWYEKAAAQGRPDALGYLGLIYEQGGEGVAMDKARAMQYYRKAAEKNDALGQMGLGRLIQDGINGDPDLVQAYKWFYLASLNGEKIADHYLNLLNGKDVLVAKSVLTPDQINEAVRQAKEFKKALALKNQP